MKINCIIDFEEWHIIILNSFRLSLTLAAFLSVKPNLISLINIDEISLLSLIILIFFNSIVLSILGFAILGIGTSSIIPIAYSLAGKIKGIEGGIGITIVSTSKGIMTHKQAWQERLGGEVICVIW